MIDDPWIVGAREELQNPPLHLNFYQVTEIDILKEGIHRHKNDYELPFQEGWHPESMHRRIRLI